MGRDVSCTLDTFAATLDHILAEVGHDVESGVPKVVEKGARKARKLTRSNAKGAGWHKGKTDARYLSGWAYKVHRAGRETSAEVGNRAVPGLPHLLEKGHAKVGGGRTTAYEHIAPAADEAFDYTFDEMEKMVGRALL